MGAEGYVLIVDDGEDDVLLLRRHLKKVGIHRIKVARDGQAALDLLLAQATKLPFAVVLDLKLPKILGKEVLKQLRQHPRTAGLPVIVVSTSPEDLAQLQEAACYGALAFIPKAFGQEEFTENLRVLKNFSL